MLDRTTAPPFHKTIALSLPDPVTVGGSAEFPIFYLSGLKQNIVKIEVIFYSGKWVEPRVGLSNFTAIMIEKGTIAKSSEQIAAALDLYGASLEISPGFDFVSVALYSLKSKIKSIFPLFIELLTEPSFDEKELQLMLDIFRQNLKISNEKTSYVASKLIRKKVFGDAHPYGSSVELADTELIHKNDLQSFFKEAWSVHSAYILGELSVGDLTILTQGLDSLPKRQLAIGARPNIGAADMAENSKPGRTQATIRLGKKSLLRSAEDYPDLLLATHLLGGFFGSRLMKNIREEKGLTYGISASLNAFRMESLFVIGADVNKENADEAVSEIRKELVSMMTVPAGEEELKLAKNHFIGSLQTDMANLFSVEEKLKNIHLNGLSKYFYHDLVTRVDQMTPEEVMKTANTHFDVDSFIQVVVG